MLETPGAAALVGLDEAALLAAEAVADRLALEEGALLIEAEDDDMVMLIELEPVELESAVEDADAVERPGVVETPCCFPSEIAADWTAWHEVLDDDSSVLTQLKEREARLSAPADFGSVGRGP